MPTVRRLFNKKAYEEMVLLQKRCDTQNAKDSGLYFVPVLKVDEKLKERFCIYISASNKNATSLLSRVLTGRTYTEVEKELSRYLNGE